MWQLAAISLLLIASIAAIDHATGYELSFSIFYLIPVGISAWYGGKTLGLPICVLSAAAWLAVDYLALQQYSHAAIPFWNAGVRFGFFTIVAYLLNRLRTNHDYQSSLAQQDGLTGLLNARAFRQRCVSLTQLASRHGHPIVVAYLDLDDFKRVNDTLGHSRGDEVLKAVASTLVNRLRGSDVVGRLGGDEFAVILPETDIDNARGLIAELREKLVALAERHRWPIGFSIGVAVFEAPPANPDDAIHFADELMYRVKAEGKNSILFAEYASPA
jgi:diguanylate cyclase (GGDEF)-like protein